MRFCMNSDWVLFVCFLIITEKESTFNKYVHYDWVSLKQRPVMDGLITLLASAFDMLINKAELCEYQSYRTAPKYILSNLSDKS